MSQVMPERRPPARAERSPFADLDQLGERMRRMLEQTFGDFALALTEPIGWIPAVDLEEQDDAYVVEAEVPGVKREDGTSSSSGTSSRSPARSRRRNERASFVARRDAWDASNSESRFLTKSTRRRSTPSSPKAC